MLLTSRSIYDGYLTSNISLVTQEQLGRILWSVLCRRSDHHLNNPSSLNFQLFWTLRHDISPTCPLILSEKKKKRGIIRTDSRHFVKNEFTQVNIWHKEKTPFITRNKLNCTSATAKYSFPSRWKVPPFLLEHRLLTKLHVFFLCFCWYRFNTPLLY